MFVKEGKGRGKGRRGWSVDFYAMMLVDVYAMMDVMGMERGVMYGF